MIAVHARTTDIPDWTSPPLVRDIPHHQGSWGWVHASDSPASTIIQDEQGYLWAEGDVSPRSGPPDRRAAGAILCWTEQGLGVWVHPDTRSIRVAGPHDAQSRSSWVPIATVLHTNPAHIMDANGGVQ